MNTIEEITKYSKYLRLPGIKGNLKKIANEARESEMNYEEFLRTLLEEEYKIRKQNAIQSRIRTAKFPQRKYLEDLKEEYLPKDAQNKL
jgi:DNA replication protein DnaC